MNEIDRVDFLILGPIFGPIIQNRTDQISARFRPKRETTINRLYNDTRTAAVAAARHRYERRYLYSPFRCSRIIPHLLIIATSMII